MKNKNINIKMCAFDFYGITKRIILLRNNFIMLLLNGNSFVANCTINCKALKRGFSFYNSDSKHSLIINTCVDR